jgi:hypothetical protein
MSSLKPPSSILTKRKSEEDLGGSNDRSLEKQEMKEFEFEVAELKMRKKAEKNKREETGMKNEVRMRVHESQKFCCFCQEETTFGNDICKACKHPSSRCSECLFVRSRCKQ